jgi:hypothetical protein
MTSTLPRSTGYDQPEPRLLRRQRSSRLLVLGVLLATVAALLGAYTYRGAVSRDSVVATVRALPFGSLVQITDLREVPLPPGTGLATVVWRDVDSVVGRIAATDLRAGQTLTPDAVTDERSPRPGEAVVGLSVGPGRVPSTALSVRDEVLVFTGPSGPPRQASVVRAGEPDATGRRTVDVLVTRADATGLASASVDDRVVIVLVGRRAAG